MSDKIETQEVSPEVPKKPRKPRAKKTAAPAVKTDAPKRKGKLPNEVRHEGKHVFISGADPRVAPELAADKAKHGIKDVSGPEFGKSCKDEVCVITFKSPAAARKFFEYAFGFEDDDGAYEPINCGSKTDWHGEGMDTIFG